MEDVFGGDLRLLLLVLVLVLGVEESFDVGEMALVENGGNIVYMFIGGKSVEKSRVQISSYFFTSTYDSITVALTCIPLCHQNTPISHPNSISVRRVHVQKAKVNPAAGVGKIQQRRVETCFSW